MAANITELILKFRGDSGDLKSTMAQVRAELSQTAKTQTIVNKGELSMRQQLAAAASLQRQRSAALFGEWKKTEQAAKSLATGVQPVGTNLQRITDVMQALGSSSATLTGPLGGIAGRLRSLGALSTEAAGGLGLVGVAVAALAVGVTAAVVIIGAAFVRLIAQTAEFQGRFFDLSQQVGVAVETLSTLSIIASTTGGDIDTVTASLALFQRNLEDSHDPTSKEAKLLKELGVTARDTETALRQSLKGLFDLGQGSRQTDAVLQLFGRSGRFINAILKESSGDLDAATKKFQQMGLVVSTEAAIAADQFNDSLTILAAQLSAIGRILVTESIPVFVAFFEDIGRGLTGNQENWKSWGNVIETEVAVALGILEGFVQWVATRFTIDLGTAIDSSIRGLLDRAAQSRAAIGVTAAAERAALLSGGRPRTTGGKGKATQDEIFRADIERAKEAAAKELEQQRHLSELLKLTFEESRASLEEFYKGRQTLIDAHFNTLIDQINSEQQALDEARARGRIKTADAIKKDAELIQRTTEAQNKLDEETRRNKLERQKALDKEELDLNKQLAAIRDAQREGELKRLQDALDRGAVSEANAITRRLEIEKEGQGDRLLLLNLEINQLSTLADRKIEIDNEKIASEQKFTDETKRLVQERIDALIREQTEAAKVGLDVEGAGARATGRVPVPTGAPPAPNLETVVEAAVNVRGAFEGLGAIISDTVGLGAQQIGVFGDMVASTFGQIAQGVGEAVKAFVLFGGAQGSFKKFAAEVIASVAQMAAVQAVFELAQGLAMLALNFFFPNPRYAKSAATHFAAAAVFGGIGAVVAGIGRAVAGNSFNEGGGGGEGGPTITTEPARDRRIREGRTGGVPDPNAQQIIGRVAVDLKYPDGYVETKMVEIYNRNGNFRGRLRSDLLGEANG